MGGSFNKITSKVIEKTSKTAKIKAQPLGYFSTKNIKTVHLPKDEYAHVKSEINTHMSDSERGNDMFCQNCFKSVREDAQVCEHCGAEIEYKTYKVPTNKDIVTKYMNFARRIWKAALCTTLVIVFLLLLVFVVIFPSYKPYSLKNSEYEYLFCGTHVKLTRYIGEAEKVEVPNRILFFPVKGIGKECFFENAKITEVFIPDGITEIEAGAFAFCKNLTEAKLPSDLKVIPDAMFRSTGLQQIEIPLSVETIGWAAFRFTKLTEVTIPESVSQIDSDAFSRCKELEKVELPKTIKKVSKYAFEETPWLTSRSEEFVIVGNGILIGYNGDDRTVEIPEGILYIADGGFRKIMNSDEENMIETIILPKSLELLDNSATDLENLKYVVFQNDLPNGEMTRVERSAQRKEITVVAPQESSIYKKLKDENAQCITLEEYNGK